MGDAYQCDRCSEFDTKTPARFKLRQFHSTTAFGWGDSETKHKLELCDDCAESLESAVGEWFDAGGEDGDD